jgi:hypothetical protein
MARNILTPILLATARIPSSAIGLSSSSGDEDEAGSVEEVIEYAANLASGSRVRLTEGNFGPPDRGPAGENPP